ncbi:telomerase binding protein EST1A [Echinococcus multilocularis]|uniref:Telomerase binding protein EST1A n=1 Tax=Echinococcus multilocularis TaxID=6211 RepID=A0A068YBR0_ECHMU|nr:telomerase binding protein EST1A [Echinococcus multilocularis]
MSTYRRPDRLIYRPPSNRTVAVNVESAGVKSLNNTGSHQMSSASDDLLGTPPSEYNISNTRRNAPENIRTSERNQSHLDSHGECNFEAVKPEALSNSLNKGGMCLSSERNEKSMAYPTETGESAMANPLSRHGGLIHLPKNVNIFNQSSPNGGNLGSAQRDACLKSSNKSGIHSSRESPGEGTTVGALPTISTSAGLRGKDLQLFEQPNGAYSSVLAQLSSKPSSPTVAEAVYQIMQIDSALNALLVPPGQCISHIPPLPDEQSENKLQMPESERLFLRWWATLENLRSSLMVNYERVILEDLDFCNAAQIEQGMWKSVFYTVLEFLRPWIANPYLTGLLPKPEESESGQAVAAAACSRMIKLIRKVCLEDVIRIGEHRLTGLLNRLQAIRHIHLDYVLSEGRPPPESGSRTCRLMYISAQKLMLYLGDLARYEEIINGGQNFGKARSWYQKAQLLIPKSGKPYNQLALLAIYTSRHFDAMCYYMRSLAASNPFPTASQSLSALFNEVHTHGAEFLRKKSTSSQWPPGYSSSQTGLSSNRASNIFTRGRPKRVEIWIHPVNGTETIVQGNRSLTVPNAAARTEAWRKSKKIVGTANSLSLPSDELLDDENEEGEEAQADAEEYANMSLIELTKLFGLHFMHAHGQLFTKIGMETFPEVASMALQALSGLLAQRPCPLSEDRLCQILMVNMFNLDRAAIFTAQSAVGMVAAIGRSKIGAAEVSRRQQQQQLLQRKPKVESETLRSVHHDHAARFALDTFSLICRRAAKLFTESRAESRTSGDWLHPDLRILLPALRLWTEWMILHPEHWSPPPNHRDPTLHPRLDDWRLVAEMCTHAAQWFAGVKSAPSVKEITPTTALVVQLHLRKHMAEADGDHPDATAELVNRIPAFLKYTTLFEETVCAGFKPMLDLIPKMYQYSGDWDAESVAHYIRIEKILLFGDFLCGIEPPVLSYDVDKAIYEPVVECESFEQGPIKKSASCYQSDSESPTGSDAESEVEVQSGGKSVTAALKAEKEEGIEENEGGEEICALRRRRAVLRSQLTEARRLEAWRQQAVRQAAAGGPRGIEIEVRPIYILPDTNCYIDWLEGVARLTQTSSNYTVLVPIVVFNELDNLASQDRAFAFNSIEIAFAQYLTNPSSTSSEFNGSSGGRANLIQERAKAAIAFLEGEFNRRNPRLRALTAKGSMLETIAYRNEANGGKQPGQINDDVILTCCRRFCKEVLAQISAEGNLVSTAESKNQPMRVTREVVLLTSDRNLRLKALSLNIPARPLRPFVEWSSLKPVAVSAVSSLSSNDVDPPLSAHTSSGRWKNRKHPK